MCRSRRCADRIAPARGNRSGSGRWRSRGQHPSAVPERRRNVRPARQRQRGAHGHTDSARSRQHCYSTHYQLRPIDGPSRFGGLMASRSIKILNQQLSRSSRHLTPGVGGLSSEAVSVSRANVALFRFESRWDVATAMMPCALGIGRASTCDRARAAVASWRDEPRPQRAAIVAGRRRAIQPSMSCQ